MEKHPSAQNIVFDYELIVRESYLDTFGHMNNAAYLEILEEARWEAITQNGYGLQQIAKSGLGPVVLEINLKFFKEIRLRERIRIRTQLASYMGKIGVLHQWIENEKGETCTEARFTMGLFDTRQRKLVEPTTEWLKAVGVQAQ